MHRVQRRFPLDERHPRDISLYGLDIETDTTVDGLDPARSSVVAAAVVGDGVELVIQGDEAELLAELDAALAELPPGVLVTWNGARFDLPFLADRARECGVPLGLDLWSDPAAQPDGEPLTGHPDVRYQATWHTHHHLDGYRLYRSDAGRALGLSCGLKNMARFVGLDAISVDRERIHDLDLDLLTAYVASDARLARELVLRRGSAALAAIDRR